MKTKNKTVDKLPDRLARWRGALMTIAYNSGLSYEEIAKIFGTTRQNATGLVKKYKKKL